MMAHYLALLLALTLALPLQAAKAAPSPNLATGLRLIRSRTPRNLERGARLVHMAAAAGEAEAEYVMGRLFLKGTGTSRSPQRAVRWFRQAAEKGHVKAQLALGKLLGRSQSMKLRKEAWRWLEAAHGQGAPSAKKLLAALADRGVGDMTKTPPANQPAPEVTVINMGRGEPATPEQLAAQRALDERRASEAAARQKQWAEKTAAQRSQEREAREAQAKASREAATKEAEARRKEAADRAARRAAGLPELPRGQLSPHLRGK